MNFHVVSRETSLEVKERELLKNTVEQLGFSITSDQIRYFASYYELLLMWNREVGLISEGDEGRIVPRHFVESLLVVPFLVTPSRESMLDIGSGAGFPGLPVKILLPHLRVDFLEPKRRRASFLRKVIGVLDLPSTQVICSRIEDVEKWHVKREYDAIITRAVAHPLELLQHSLPLLAHGGDFIAYIPRDLTVDPDDLPDGISEWVIRHVGLPGLCDEREIFVARRE